VKVRDGRVQDNVGFNQKMKFVKAMAHLTPLTNPSKGKINKYFGLNSSADFIHVTTGVSNLSKVSNKDWEFFWKNQSTLH
jgi:hypothetical protein